MSLITLPHTVILGAILEMVAWELLKQIGRELFIILLNDPNVLTETIVLCMKEYSALHNFFNTINYTSQATKWNHFVDSTHVPT